jgi:hypothetical protein
MKVVLFGASGMIGSRILAELISRGHKVTAVVRNPERVTAIEVQVIRGDLTDAASVASAVAGADAVLSAYAPPQGKEQTLLLASRSLVEGAEMAGVRRLLVVSGAGSLEVAEGVQLLDTPQFPAAWLPIARAHRDALPILEASGLEWTALSPAAMIEPGERTGKFRLGGIQFLVDGQGESRISAEDFAVAMVDELENSQHVRSRFTVAY